MDDNSSLGGASKASLSSRFDTTTQRTYEAVFEGDNLDQIIPHDQLVKDLNARVQENRVTSIQLSAPNQQDIVHPNRTKTAEGKRLPFLRQRKPLELFDTEARTAQRDAPVEASVYSEMLSSNRNDAKNIKAARSASNLRIAHTSDHIANWNKRSEFKGLDPAIPKAVPIRQAGGEGIGYGGDVAMSYDTSAKSAMRSGVVAREANAMPMQSHLVTAAERRLKLAGAHWQIGTDPDTDFWNKRRTSKAAPQLTKRQQGHPQFILPMAITNKPSSVLGAENKARANDSQVELGKDGMAYETTMQRAIPRYSISSTFDRVTDRTFADKAFKSKYQSSVVLGDHPGYM